MNRPRHALLVYGYRALAFSLVAIALAGPLRAGTDDYEFGQKLSQKGYFDYAKRVFERMLADPSRSAADKDRAKYGMALLGREEAVAFAGKMDSTWADIKAKYDAAASSIQDFISKNGSDPKADPAKIELGTLYLLIVTWINDHLNPDEPDLTKRDEAVKNFLKRRQTTKEVLYDDAQKDVEKAIALFDEVQKGTKTDPASLFNRDLGAYQFATAQYFRGLVFPPCSPQAKEAFKKAAETLENYAGDNDDRLTGSYAMDFLGLATWEIAKCETDANQRTLEYQKAHTWFQACTDIPYETLEHLRLITRGFYHLAQMSFEAGRQSGKDFWKEGSKDLARIEKIPQATNVPHGCRAYIEWARIEAARKNFDAAIKWAKLASDAAKAQGFGSEEQLANKTLQEVVKAKAEGGDSSPTGGDVIDPGVIVKIADSLYSTGKHAEAVGAYQQTISAAPRTPEAVVKYVVPSWMKIGKCYESMGLLVEAAMAYESIVDEWKARRIPRSDADADANRTAVYLAANAERRTLNELVNKTGDPVLRARYDDVAAFLINDPDMKKEGSKGGTDLAYTQGLSFFNQATAEKNANPSGAAWKALLASSKENFSTASKNVGSERQDNAWVYLVRIPETLDDAAGTLAAADAAFAYWGSAEAKKKEADIPGIAESRKNCVAQVTFYKAAALYDLKRHADALKLLEGYEGRFPKVDPPVYKMLAIGLQVQLLLATDKVQEADALTARLIRDYPDYFLLAKIVFQLAQFYEDKAKAVDARIVPIDSELYGPNAEERSKGVLERIRQAIKDEGALSGHIADLNNQVAREERICQNEKNAVAAKTACDKAEELKKLVAAEMQRLDDLRKEKAVLEARTVELQTERAKIKSERVAPRSMAAQKYWEWDQAVMAADAKSDGRKKRLAENVRTFAGLYYNLGRDKPEERSYWERAKALYEAYLSFPEIKDLPNSDERKRAHLGRLGDADYRLAGMTSDLKEARTLYEEAVDRLQSVLAKHPANTPLITGHLSGEYVTLPWPDQGYDRAYRIPVRRLPDVLAFKQYVAELKDERLPKYADEGQDARYRESVRRFQEHVDRLQDGDVKRVVDSLKNGGFDPVFFSEYAVTQKEFLFPLAHAYAKAGTPGSARKAQNVTQAILSGANKVDDDSADWWEAKTIALEVYVAEAERALSSAGTAAPEAAQSAKQANTMLSSTKRIYPHIGGVERREQTLKEWLAIQTRLRTVLGRLSILEEFVDLTQEAAPPAPPADPAAMDDVK